MFKNSQDLTTSYASKHARANVMFRVDYSSKASSSPSLGADPFKSFTLGLVARKESEESSDDSDDSDSSEEDNVAEGPVCPPSRASLLREL